MVTNNMKVITDNNKNCNLMSTIMTLMCKYRELNALFQRFLHLSSHMFTGFMDNCFRKTNGNFEDSCKLMYLFNMSKNVERRERERERK